MVPIVVYRRRRVYSCAEQFMMAEKNRLFNEHRAAELIMSSPDPRTHKRIGRGVRNFDSAAWDRGKQNCHVIWQLRQIQAEPRHETSSFRPKPALWIQCGALVSGRMIPAPKTHAIGEGKLLGEALSAVGEEIRDSETGLAHPASAGRFRTPTGNARIHEISSAPESCSLTAASACQGPP